MKIFLIVFVLMFSTRSYTIESPPSQPETSKKEDPPPVPQITKKNIEAEQNTPPPTKQKKNTKDEVLEELKLFTQGIDTLQSSSDTDPKIKQKTGDTETETQKDPSDHQQEDDMNRQITLIKQSDIPSLELLAEQYQKQGDSRAHARILDILITKKPSNIRFKLDRIQVKRKLEYDPYPNQIKKNELAQELQKLIKMNPKHEDTYWNLFDLNHHYVEWTENTSFSSDNEIQNNLALLKDIKRQFKESQKTSKYLCQYLILSHFYNEARPQCQKAKQMNPKDPEVYIFADYILSGQNKKILLKTLKNFPQSKKLYTIVGQMFLEKKDYTLSMKYFKKAVKMDDSYIPALLGLAESLLYVDQINEALTYYIESCKKNILKTRLPFQKAKAYLSQKSLFQKASQYQNQINICVNASKLSNKSY